MFYIESHLELHFRVQFTLGYSEKKVRKEVIFTISFNDTKSNEKYFE